MSRQTIEATEVKTSHANWRRWHFDHLERKWYLIITPSEEGLVSQIGVLDEDRKKWWDHWQTLVLRGVELTPDAAAVIISRVLHAHTNAIEMGVQRSRAEIRAVLGVRP